VRARANFRELIDGLPSSESWSADDGEYTLMLNVKFFGDDSFARHGPGFQGCCAVAGLLGVSSAWKDLVPDWRAACHSERRIEYFRMREFIERSGQFFGFDNAEAEAKLESLASVIESHGEAFAILDSIITWDTYDHAVHAAFKDFCKSPYFFGVMGIILALLEVVRDQGKAQPVRFIFDEQVGLEIPIHQSFVLAKSVLSAEQAIALETIAFADDRRVMPLQCADLVAWQVRREYLQLPEDKGKPPAMYTRLDESIYDWKSITWNEQKLREFFSETAARFTAGGKFHLNINAKKRAGKPKPRARKH
jgi:hypothetical protein